MDIFFLGLQARVETHVLARVVTHVLVCYPMVQARVLVHVLARVVTHVLAHAIMNMHVHGYYLKTCVLGAYFEQFLKNCEPRNTPKECFFQERGRKRVREWCWVTFMKEWMKALVDSIRIFWH